MEISSTDFAIIMTFGVLLVIHCIHGVWDFVRRQKARMKRVDYFFEVEQAKLHDAMYADVKRAEQFSIPTGPIYQRHAQILNEAIAKASKL